ncbi:DUF6049 family protein [Ornithinimicrobium tianjinense]|uniref:Uncharacterized protein n=1 Tax=Ornithinimicrobium tianjinense TaxID=1195761 RepID=A0A917BNF6_9MICO|nr:DUF6049 family protein [Ornithinimicrobium tianjinense]GGF52978.1 hypothetical protein GCM10011366_20930 [Ornithinimicrobium tianjinense]
MLPPARRTAWAARTRAAACAVGLTAALAAPGLPATGASVPSGYAAHDPVPGLRVVLDDVEPTVPTVGEPVTLRGRVVNDSERQQRIGHVSAEATWGPVTTRAGLDDWLDGDPGLATDWLLGSDTVGPVVAAGSEVPFTIRLDEDALDAFPVDRGVLGLELHAHDEADGEPGLVFGTAPATLRSVLVVGGGTTVGQPLRTAWVVPLTLPPDGDLVTPDDTRWETAWAAAAGEGSVVRTWLEGLTVPGVTWAVDPALVAPARVEPLAVAPEEPGEEPSDETTSDEQTSAEPSEDTATATTAPEVTPPSTDGATTTEEPGGGVPTDGQPSEGVPTTVDERVDALVDPVRRRLADVDPASLWWLPVADPDLEAVLAGAEDAELRAALAQRLSDPEAARALLDRGRRDVAWPVGSPVASTVDRLAGAWRATGADLGAVVLPREAVGIDSGAPVSTAALTTLVPEGLGVLATDSRASALLAAAADEGAAHGAGASAQHLLADSLVTWQQDERQDRSLVVAAPRGTRPDPAVLAELSDGIDRAGWIAPVPASVLLDEATRSPVDPAELTGGEPEPGTLGELTAYLDAGASPLDEQALRSVASVRRHLLGLRQVLDETGSRTVGGWEQALAASRSTRWRDVAPEVWSESWRPVRTASTRSRQGLHVNPGTINFLSEQGLMRVTIVNSLPVAVENVRVQLVSGSGVLQVIDQPEPITVGPDSRATVTFGVRAVTRGDTTVRALLSAPNGTPFGDDAAVEVHVQPPGVWIYWVLGSLGGLVLAVGLVRALRATPRAVLAGVRRPQGPGDGSTPV